MNKKSTKLLWLIIIVLVAVDTLSKILAYHLIPPGRTVPVLGDLLYFYVLINADGLNPLAEALTQNNQTLVLLVSLLGVIFSVFFIVMRKVPWKLWLKIVTGVILYFILESLFNLIANRFPLFDLNPQLVSILKMIGPLTLYITLFLIIKRLYPRVALTLMIGGGLGNFLSSFYPPFGVVDFLGTSFMPNMIFNIADVFGSAGILLLFTYPIVALVLYLQKKKWMRSWETLRADGDDIETVQQAVFRTIDTCYPAVYPPLAVEYFKQCNSADLIRQDAQAGFTVLLRSAGKIIATGTIVDGSIKRVYIDPAYQSRGLGSAIMDILERKAAEQKTPVIRLESSLNALDFYQSRGYRIAESKFIALEDNQRLDYYYMEKRII